MAKMHLYQNYKLNHIKEYAKCSVTSLLLKNMLKKTVENS